jgi:predicted RNase H-like nuclease (RuvC/YqgF family)
MKVIDEDIQTLTNQIEVWSIQISVLAAKKEAATATAKQFAQELDELRTKHLIATQQIREIELHQSGMYMWENIGDGG